ncbi:MAG: cupin domain-containing protein, partial [Phycisphaeraceae bacterium]
MAYQVSADADIIAQQLPADESFPNNPTLPLLLYRQAVRSDDSDAAAAFEQLFHDNGWRGSWRNGVFSYHHYHPNAHEVLGVCAGEARIQFGGPDGPILEIAAGDVAILPAGAAHKNIDSDAAFEVVGAYPAGQTDYETLRGEPNERPRAEQRIAQVPLPAADPVYGKNGPLLDYWY